MRRPWLAALFLGSAALFASSPAPALEYSARNLIAPYFAVEGTVYDEPGNEVGTFELRSTSRAVRFDAADVVPEGVPFGSMRLELRGNGGSVFTEHRASGRFSVGVPGTCVPAP